MRQPAMRKSERVGAALAVGAAISGVAVAVCSVANEPAAALFFVLISVAFAVAAIAASVSERRRLASSGIAQIDLMDGITFERYLETLFRRLGYSVRCTGVTGDFGADLIVTRAGASTVIQAKRYRRRVGVKAVQEAVAARGMYRCAAAIVVTNNYYTDQATQLAKANSVALWDRDELVKMILSTKNVQG